MLDSSYGLYRRHTHHFVFSSSHPRPALCSLMIFSFRCTMVVRFNLAISFCCEDFKLNNTNVRKGWGQWVMTEWGSGLQS